VITFTPLFNCHKNVEIIKPTKSETRKEQKAVLLKGLIRWTWMPLRLFLYALTCLQGRPVSGPSANTRKARSFVKQLSYALSGLVDMTPAAVLRTVGQTKAPRHAATQERCNSMYSKPRPLDGGEWLTSRPGLFASRKKNTHVVGHEYELVPQRIRILWRRENPDLPRIEPQSSVP
jgi:hypothetical protein